MCANALQASVERAIVMQRFFNVCNINLPHPRLGFIWLLLAVMVLAGCQVQDENTDWDPQADLPPWAYDAPFYYRPSEDLEMLETIGEDIGVYYTKDDYFFIRHPSGYQLTAGPRVGVWFSADEGVSWEKAGFFGVEQTHFLFKAETNGPYWIRFVGPGQGRSTVPPGQPHRIYVVDTHPPTVSISVDPPPVTVDAEGNKVVHLYRTGETITLYWGIGDQSLDPNSIQLGVAFTDFPNNVLWSRWPDTLGESGSMQVEIPQEATQDGGLKFRLEARDKAGNIGAAFTEKLIIEGSHESRAAEIAVSELVAQAGGQVSAKPGWPLSGQFLRGGADRLLAWLPPSAENYPVVQLQFSSNDGRLWQTVAADVIPGKVAMWTVPKVFSERCRLKVIGQAGTEYEKVLAISGLFVVDTIGTDTIKTD